MHIHLTTRVKDGIDESTGELREGVKGNAYVQIDAVELVKYHCDGSPVELWINEKGVILTRGAAGTQPNGGEFIRKDCIPAVLCQKILYVHNGRPVRIEEE